MPTISEIPKGGNSPMHAVLTAGLKTLSGDEHVTFRLYRRWINPVDGMAYWLRVQDGYRGVRSEVLPGLTHSVTPAGECVQAVAGGLGAIGITGGQIINPLLAVDQGVATAESIWVSLTGPCECRADEDAVELKPGHSFAIPPEPKNGVFVNAVTGGHLFTVAVTSAVAALSASPLTIEQPGSLHYTAVVEQQEDTVVENNQIIFTSPTVVQPFGSLETNELYIGERDAFRFAFSSHGSFYEEANLYHYLGESLSPVDTPLIIDDPVGWVPSTTISNSLPLWLVLPGYVPPYDEAFRCGIPLYPSFLVTDNLEPPFGAVHIETTTPLGGSPIFGPHLEQDQFSKDVVRVTLYGVDNLGAQTFLAFILQYCCDWHTFGVMNSPVVVDEKRPQPEFKILSQKKVIQFDVSYWQRAARNETRKLIDRAQFQWLCIAPTGWTANGIVVTLPLQPTPHAPVNSGEGGFRDQRERSIDRDDAPPQEGLDAAERRKRIARRDEADQSEVAARPALAPARKHRRARHLRKPDHRVDAELHDGNMDR
jgi:hypothetical protein